MDALLRGKSLKEASESGNRLGALAATKKGATQIITQDELDNIAFENHRIFDQSFTRYGD